MKFSKLKELYFTTLFIQFWKEKKKKILKSVLFYDYNK
jgi:hypothetical protein